MPTPTGKPKVGERVRVYDVRDRSKFADGVVIQRSDGSYWTLQVQFDGSARPMLVEAAWLASRGALEVLAGQP